MAASNLTNFAGQVVLVTGAASGIGKAAAELIAQRGGKVICLDLNEDGLKITVAQIEQLIGIRFSSVAGERPTNPLRGGDSVL
jgi:NAD(P)-dependent dehydrogenase (short-subunit alcohol dehydrogenase family)